MTEETEVTQTEVTQTEVTQTEVVETPVVAETVESTVTETIEDTTVDTTETPAVTEVEETKEISQEAFNKLYFEKMQAQRELEALKAPQVEAPTIPAVSTAPTLASFDYDEEAHQTAMIDFKVDQKLAQAMEQRTVDNKVQEAEVQRQNVQLAFNDKAVLFAAENPNYNAAIEASNGAEYPSGVGEVLLHSEVGPELDYELLTNPAKVAELAAMTTVQSIMEMGRMEDAIKAKKSKPPAVSQAPAPIEDQVGGGGRVAVDYVNENTSMEEFYAASQAAKIAKLNK